MTIRVDVTAIQSLTTRIDLLTDRQLRMTTALALQQTTLVARDHLRQELAKPSGGPIEGGATRWTIGGTYAQRFVNPADLTSEVGFASAQPHAAGRYLAPLIRGERPVVKGLDLKISGGRRDLVFIPARSLARTPQGNLTRSAVRTVADGTPFVVPLRRSGGAVLGVFVRGEARIGRTDTYEPTLRLLGVLKTGRPRRQTLDLQRMLQPVVSAEFSVAMGRALAETLRRAGL
jgi:hypothetical protein